ncbi:Predicted oxidoreductase [Halopelagius longus]|uniref:Predicted oxidoreductase n=2 Tax=Halopelagius longus TaxID=1236180 RepID=A0A1H1BTU1_9EURY|nr:Predicted oxidoreductase [Halopelagius longus]
MRRGSVRTLSPQVPRANGVSEWDVGESIDRGSEATEEEALAASVTFFTDAGDVFTMSLDYRRLGTTGTKVSELCFGTWRFGRKTGGVLETSKEEAHELLDAYVERGGNFIDTANVYGDPNGTSEDWIGDWLSDYDREQFVVASKVYFGFDDENPNGSGLSRTHVRNQIEGTLDRLGTDYLDLYYIHRWDEETPIEETLSTLDRLVEEGKVNYLGASTMAAWQLTKALWKSDVEDYERFEVTQPLFHAGYYEDVADYLDVCGDQGLAVCPYSPLAGGFLTGKYERADPDDPTIVEAPDGSRADFDERFDQFYLSERGWHVLDAVRDVAEEVDATPAQVSLRWLMDYPEATVVPIVGARTVEQLDENVGAADVDLSDDQWERIMDARYGEDGKLIH